MGHFLFKAMMFLIFLRVQFSVTYFFSGGPVGVGYVIPSSANGLAWIVMPVISGGSTGVDFPLIGNRSHLSSVSHPSKTCPKTVWRLFKWGCCSYKIKNWDLFLINFETNMRKTIDTRVDWSVDCQSRTCNVLRNNMAKDRSFMIW